MPETVPSWAFITLVVVALCMSGISLWLSVRAAMFRAPKVEIGNGGHDTDRAVWELQWMRPFPFPTSHLGIVDLPVVIRNNGGPSVRDVRVDLSHDNAVIASAEFDIFAGRTNEYVVPFPRPGRADISEFEGHLLRNRAAVAQLSTCVASITWTPPGGSAQRQRCELPPLDTMA